MKTSNIWLRFVPFLVACALAQEVTPEQMQKAKDLLSSNPEALDQLINQQHVKSQRDSLVSKSKIEEVRDKTGREHMLPKGDSTDTLRRARTVPKPADTTAKRPDTLVAKLPRPDTTLVYGVQLFADSNIGGMTVDVPEEYVIVPGDQILLRLWGRYNLEKIYTVGEDGYVFMDPLNKQTYLKGMTHRRLKQMIQGVIKEMAGVEGEAKVIASHPISIHVSGFAKVPGTMLVTPYATFWQVLMQSKGPSPLGSVREINLIRDNRIVHSFDIYEYLQTGRIANVGLTNNDVLFFSARKKIVELGGLTNITGRFELKPNETLGDLVTIAGNFSSKNISPLVHVERQVPLSERKSGGPTNQATDLEITGNDWKGFRLQEGDVIGELVKRYELKNQVYIAGRGIKVPGKYSIQDGKTTFGELVAKAGGLEEGHDRMAEVLRHTPLGKKSEQLDLSGTVAGSFVLQSNDSILTYQTAEFKDTTFVLVHGFVRKQDTLPYAESMTLKDVIQRAGGIRDGGLSYVFVKQTDSNGIVNYAKADLKDADAYQLRPRDEVIAYDYRDFNRRFPVTVLVDDTVPTYLEYSDGLNLDFVLHAIGGLRPNSDSAHIEVYSPSPDDSAYHIERHTYAATEENLHRNGLIRPGAVVVVRENPLKVMPAYVTLIGDFKQPGQYVLKSRLETLESVVNEAGGLGQRANPYGISIKRKNSKSIIPVLVKSVSPLRFSGGIPLVRDDTVFVQDNNQTISISGAVLNVGTTQYVEGSDWKYYVDEGAGGTLDTADVDKTFIIYPNGTAAKAHMGWLRNSDVRPGSEIVVPFKPYKDPAKVQPTDWAKVTASVSAVLGVLLSVLIILQNVKNL